MFLTTVASARCFIAKRSNLRRITRHMGRDVHRFTFAQLAGRQASTLDQGLRVVGMNHRTRLQLRDSSK